MYLYTGGGRATAKALPFGWQLTARAPGRRRLCVLRDYFTSCVSRVLVGDVRAGVVGFRVRGAFWVHFGEHSYIIYSLIGKHQS